MGPRAVNTNPVCTRCGGRTFRASQTCFVCGRDQRDVGIVIVQEDPRDYTRARRQYDEEQVLPGFEGLV